MTNKDLATLIVNVLTINRLTEDEIEEQSPIVTTYVATIAARYEDLKSSGMDFTSAATQAKIEVVETILLQANDIDHPVAMARLQLLKDLDTRLKQVESGLDRLLYPYHYRPF